MPNLLDIFNSDAYSTFELTDTIEMLPYQPTRLGSMGLFEERGVNTIVIGIERRGKKLALVPTRDRGVQGVANPRTSRDLRYFRAPHLPIDDVVLADDMIGVREFGSADAVAGINSIVNDRLEEMKNHIETTKEYHRIGAIQGLIKDADGSTTIYNLFTEFGYSQTTVDFNLDSNTTNVLGKCAEVRRGMEVQMGGGLITGIHAFCGDAFWDALVSHEKVVDAYYAANKGEFQLDDQRVVGGFEFGNIFFENYRGKIGDVDFIPTDDCRFVPLGVRGLFKTYNAPANWIEAVGTMGKPYYAKQTRMKNDVGIELTAQANPLIIATRPNLLYRGVRT